MSKLNQEEQGMEMGAIDELSLKTLQQSSFSFLVRIRPRPCEVILLNVKLHPVLGKHTLVFSTLLNQICSHPAFLNILSNFIKYLNHIFNVFSINQ